MVSLGSSKCGGISSNPNLLAPCPLLALAPRFPVSPPRHLIHRPPGLCLRARQSRSSSRSSRSGGACGWNTRTLPSFMGPVQGPTTTRTGGTATKLVRSWRDPARPPPPRSGGGCTAGATQCGVGGQLGRGRCTARRPHSPPAPWAPVALRGASPPQCSAATCSSAMRVAVGTRSSGGSSRGRRGWAASLRARHAEAVRHNLVVLTICVCVLSRVRCVRELVGLVQL
jgi:hypothetical protein